MAPVLGAAVSSPRMAALPALEELVIASEFSRRSVRRWVHYPAFVHQPRDREGARVGGAIGSIVLAVVACYHGFTYAVGGSAGGRFGKHDVAPHRVQNLIGLGLALGLIAVFTVALKLLSGPSHSRTARRVGILYAVLAFAALLLTGRLS